jgi:3-deoxy-7-phosphoheptulonate synthase
VIIQLSHTAIASQISNIKKFFQLKGFEYLYQDFNNQLIVPSYHKMDELKQFDFIEKIIPIATPFQLSSKEFKEKTTFNVNGIEIGGSDLNLIAGPCSVETEEQIFSVAKFLNSQGIKFIRGGAFKPRTSPYSFRGLGNEGLKLIRKAADKYDLRVVTELMDLSNLEDVYNHTDIIQIGARNMSNFSLLAELGKTNKPIMLKRGMSAKATEWLLAADYLLCGGNENVILCERGIRSFDMQSRNVFDLGVIPLMQSLSHLPVFADPSHGVGKAAFVNKMALAAIASVADGLIIEIHPNPEQALIDGEQALNFKEFENLTGCAVLVNTSFNVRGEPIVCTPEDAYRCFMRTEMDYLVLENYVLAKTDQPQWQKDESWHQEFELD